MEKERPNLQPPRDAMTHIGKAIGALARYIKQENIEFVLPAVTGDSSGLNKFATFARRDDKSTSHRLVQPQLSGLQAIVSGLHMFMRGQVSELHTLQVANVEAAMRDVTLPFPKNAFENYLKAIWEVEKPFSPEEKKIVDAHCEVIATMLERHDYTLYEKSELLKQSLPIYEIIKPKVASASGDMKDTQFNLALNALYGDLKDDFTQIPSVKITLKGMAGAAKEITIPNRAGKPIAGAIYCSIAGKNGLFDTERFPEVWRTFTNEMLGNTKKIVRTMENLSYDVTSALRDAGYEEEMLQPIASASGFNLTPERWGGVYALLQKEMPKAAFSEYLARAVDAKGVGGSMLLEGLADLMVNINNNLPEGVKRLDIPTVDQLAPSSRFDYYGLLTALEHNVNTSLRLQDRVIAPELHREIAVLKSELCPQNGKSNLLAQSYPQQVPDARQMARIERIVTDIRTSYSGVCRYNHWVTSLLERALQKPAQDLSRA